MPFSKISCSEAESFNNIFKTLGAVTKLFKLRIIQGHEHLPGYAVLVNGVEYAETNIVDPVLPMHHGRYGQCSVQLSKQALADIAYSH